MLQRLATSLAAGPLRWQVHPAFACALGSGACQLRSKVTTGIVGLPVDPEARVHLASKAEQVLEAVKKIPADAEYRKNVEATFGYWLEAARSGQSDAEIEEKLNNQLEELLEMADDELSLIPQMAEWKPWEIPEGHKVEVVEERDIAAKLEQAAKGAT